MGEHRHRAGAFGPTSRRDAGPGRVTTAILAVPVAMLFTAHLMFGANQTVAAQTLTLACALVLAALLIWPEGRRRLAGAPDLSVPAGLFVAVLVIAGLSLTPWAIGGVHPIWAWAELPPAGTVNRSATVLEISKLLGLAAIFGAGVILAVDRRWARRLVLILAVAGVGWAAVSVALFAAGAQLGPASRLSGGFLSPNTAGTLAGMLSVILAGFVFRAWRNSEGRSPGQRLLAMSWSATGLVFLLLTLLLTASRMGALATVAAIAALMAWEALSDRGRRTPLALLALGVTILILLVAGLGGERLLLRSLETGQDFDVRATLFATHWNAFLDRPLGGHGLGTFSDLNSYYLSAETYAAAWNARAAHNVYLQWLEEAGLVGALPMFALVGWVILAAIQRAGRLARGATLLRALIAANVVVLIHGLTDFALQVPSVATFWAFLLGVQFGFGASRR